MSKTVLANVSGFTPLIDSVVTECGLMTAAVFGKMWRYCQMEDGVCKASQERLAAELGITRPTVNAHICKLIEAGYIVDKTPTLAGAPHVYADTGKAGLSISFTAKQQPVKEFDTTCKNALQQPVKEFYTKKELRDSLTDLNKDPIAQKLSDHKCRFNPNSGVIIQGWKDDFPDEIILRAIDDAASRGKCSIPYIEQILITWKAQGVPPTREEKIKNARSNHQPNRAAVPAQNDYTPDELAAEIAAARAWKQQQGQYVNV
jgi:DnaD/phage-associated family protein